MRKWEYLKRDTKNLEELDVLGLEGWELISVIHTQNGWFYYFFKREIL